MTTQEIKDQERRDIAEYVRAGADQLHDENRPGGRGAASLLRALANDLEKGVHGSPFQGHAVLDLCEGDDEPESCGSCDDCQCGGG